MKLSNKQISYLLKNGVVQNRILVKENEVVFDDNTPRQTIQKVLKLKKLVGNTYTSPGKVKWQVGKYYIVQNKRGGKGLWYCSKCELICPDIKFNSMLNNAPICKCGIGNDCGLVPLRVLITEIKKEKLLDITEEDAKKEGYEKVFDGCNVISAKNAFLSNFNFINYKTKHVAIYLKNKDNKFELNNPFVWVLDFEVKK